MKLLTRASKVITAFIENNNIFPFSTKDYSYYANQMHFETIYLQHGVLHIDMPWKYSPEKIIADKVIVACNVDYSLFRKNGYKESNLWKTGMPRFDELHKTDNLNRKRILYAPSWRSYLVGENIDGEWKSLDRKFHASKFYMGMKSFLEDKRLYKILEEYDFELDIKLHPIFQKYVNIFGDSNNKICLKDSVNEGDYALFITDFSSYMFDFIYLGIPILSFIPDYDEFKCGMNGYRNVDFIYRVDDSDVAKLVDEIIAQIEKFFETNKGMPYEVDFFENQTCGATDEYSCAAGSSL